MGLPRTILIRRGLLVFAIIERSCVFLFFGLPQTELSVDYFTDLAVWNLPAMNSTAVDTFCNMARGAR